jgi:hypothetical protein
MTSFINNIDSYGMGVEKVENAIFQINKNLFDILRRMNAVGYILQFLEYSKFFINAAVRL